MSALLFPLTGVALTLLALGMPRHFQRVFHKQPKRRTERGLRVSGWLFLAVSLGPVFTGWNEGVALVSWIALLTWHAFALALALAWRPRWTPFWPAICLAIALLSVVA